jgi:hypothetical protein
VWLATIKSHSAVLPVAVFLHAVRTEDTLERPPAHREIGRVGDGHGNSSVVRLVEGRAGKVTMRLHLKLRFDYGSSVPWVTRLEDDSGLSAIVGPNRVVLRTPVELRGDNLATVAEFSVAAGECVPFVLTHAQSHLAVPEALDWQAGLRQTEDDWRRWCGQCSYRGPWKAAVRRSLRCTTQSGSSCRHPWTAARVAAGCDIFVPTTIIPTWIFAHAVAPGRWWCRGGSTPSQ